MTVRYLVDDVDAALPFYRALGFRLADRWGPPFAIVKKKGLTLWLAGPGTSARKKLAGGALPALGGWNRIVVETDDLDATPAKGVVVAGGKPRMKPIKGPGGRLVCWWMIRRATQWKCSKRAKKNDHGGALSWSVTNEPKAVDLAIVADGVDAIVETLNDRVAALYRRCGYEVIAALPGYVGPFTRHILLKRLVSA
jgi:catechol 2,3-dioxygenase-like lactoylglutathione lyase family enzyme